uniref:Uncharacterized protein n=1 Tax=Arundo donax TaxID=35708 RepID=A0A0A9CQQ1_ARUDO
MLTRKTPLPSFLKDSACRQLLLTCRHPPGACSLSSLRSLASQIIQFS